MSNNIKECREFITAKFPNIKCDFTNLKEIKRILQNLIENRRNDLTKNGSCNEFDFKNDLELVDLEDFYAIISREILLLRKKGFKEK